jgi:hypothetical protein
MAAAPFGVPASAGILAAWDRLKGGTPNPGAGADRENKTALGCPQGFKIGARA